MDTGLFGAIFLRKVFCYLEKRSEKGCFSKCFLFSVFHRLTPQNSDCKEKLKKHDNTRNQL